MLSTPRSWGSPPCRSVARDDATGRVHRPRGGQRRRRVGRPGGCACGHQAHRPSAEASHRHRHRRPGRGRSQGMADRRRCRRVPVFPAAGWTTPCSPADETPTDPCDAQPEELDIAITIDRVETATRLKVNRVHTRWAGLRSFVADKSVVAGFAPDAEGFFWLAGQGGYGIQTSPSLSAWPGRLPPAATCRRICGRSGSRPPCSHRTGLWPRLPDRAAQEACTVIVTRPIPWDRQRSLHRAGWQPRGS